MDNKLEQPEPIHTVIYESKGLITELGTLEEKSGVPGFSKHSVEAHLMLSELTKELKNLHVSKPHEWLPQLVEEVACDKESPGILDEELLELEQIFMKMVNLLRMNRESELWKSYACYLAEMEALDD